MATIPEPNALLIRYADAGDEAAFAELVAQFKGLVYTTALRRLDSPQLAEEATQTVFSIVARKAKALQKVDHLAAWLHRTATKVASQAARSESRHQRKMKALINETDTNPASAAADDWCVLHPHLDEALEGLPERDRRVLMLRFYDGLSFREIASEVGKSEAAAQRQGHRAVERLAKTLRRKATAPASVALLTAGLAAQFTSPAPAALVTTSLAESALVSAPSLGTCALLSNTIYTMSQIKTTSIIAAAVVVALVPLSLQRVAISEQKREIDWLTESVTSLAVYAPAEDSGLATSKPGKLTAVRGRSNRSVTGRLLGLLDEFESFMNASAIDESAPAMEFMNSLRDLPEEELVELLDYVRSMDPSKELHRFLLMAIHDQVARTSPEIALQSAMEIEGRGRSESLGAALTSFAANDPKGATDWFITADKSGQLAREANRTHFVGSVFERVFAQDKAQADRLYSSLWNDRERHHALAPRMGVENTPEEQERLIDYSLEIENTDFRRWSLGVYAQGLGTRDHLGAATTRYLASAIERGNLSPEHNAHLYVAATKGFFDGRSKVLSPQDAIDWLRENSPPEFVERNLNEANAYRKSSNPNPNSQ